MKIIAVTGDETFLVEISASDLRRITEYSWSPDFLNHNSINLHRFTPGQEFDIPKVYGQAKALLETFRGIAPGLRQSAKRLEKLADEVALHEPDVSLLPKKGD